jgi:hypothetical protein
MKCFHLGKLPRPKICVFTRRNSDPSTGSRIAATREKEYGTMVQLHWDQGKGVKIEAIRRRFSVLSMGPSARGDMVGRGFWMGDSMRRLITHE